MDGPRNNLRLLLKNGRLNAAWMEHRMVLREGRSLEWNSNWKFFDKRTTKTLHRDSYSPNGGSPLETHQERLFVKTLSVRVLLVTHRNACNVIVRNRPSRRPFGLFCLILQCGFQAVDPSKKGNEEKQFFEEFWKKNFSCWRILQFELKELKRICRRIEESNWGE